MYHDVEHNTKYIALYTVQNSHGALPIPLSTPHKFTNNAPNFHLVSFVSYLGKMTVGIQKILVNKTELQYGPFQIPELQPTI